MKELQDLAKRKDIRSADSASIRVLAEKVRRGKTLTPQERQSAWAFIVRYTRNGG